VIQAIPPDWFTTPYPWPEGLSEDPAAQQKLAVLAQAILDARAHYPDSTLAQLYDPTTMPPALRRARGTSICALCAACGTARFVAGTGTAQTVMVPMRMSCIL